MKRFKIVGTVLLASCMVCSAVMISGSAASASEIEERIETATVMNTEAGVVTTYAPGTPEEDREVATIIGEGPIIEPYVSKRVIIDEAISEDGSDWYQDKGYIAYRVYVTNDSKKLLTVTVKSSGGTHKFTVSPGKGNGIIVNNAREGVQHYIDYQTSSGELEGVCNVRISDTEMSWD